MILNRLLKKTNGVFFSFIISYILILLIPVIISAVVYIQAGNIVATEVNRANTAMLGQVREVMDSQLDDINKLCLQIALNTKVQGLMYVRQPLKPFHIFTINEVISEFKAYKVANGFINDFYIFLKNSDMVVTPQALYNSSALYQEAYSYETISYQEWYRLMHTYHKRMYFPLVVKEVNGSKRRYITYLQSLPIDSSNDPDATLVILLCESKLQAAVKHINWVNQGNVLIIDKNNNILASTYSDVTPGFIRYEQLTNESGLLYRQYNSEKVAINYTTSQITDWKYISVVPTRIFFEKAEYIRRITIISILICIVLGGVAAYYFSRRNYNPISEIISTLVNKTEVNYNKQFNEFRFLKEAIYKTLDDIEAVNEKLRQKNNLLRSNFLMKLLKGKVGDSPSIYDTLSAFDLHFKSDYFKVVLFYIQDYTMLFSEEDQESVEEQLKLVQFIISNVIEELLGNSYQVHMVEYDDMIICLLNLKHNGKELKHGEEQLKISIHKAQEFLQKEFHIYFTVSISNTHQTLAGINEAYQEALDAIEYIMVVGTGGIINYEDIKMPTCHSSNYYYPLELEQRLINCIKVGDFKKVQQILNEIFDNNFSSGLISIQIAKCLMFDLISTMIKTVDDIIATCGNDFLDQLNPIERLLECETIIEMKSQMIDIMEEVCQYIIHNKEYQGYELRDRIAEYIKANYQDINLSVGKIAEELNMNPAYISRTFKIQSGESLSSYINKLRVNKAKELLVNRNLNISDIAVMVGYYNSNAFIRAFKRVEGITPGKYREINFRNSPIIFTL